MRRSIPKKRIQNWRFIENHLTLDERVDNGTPSHHIYSFYVQKF